MIISYPRGMKDTDHWEQYGMTPESVAENGFEIKTWRRFINNWGLLISWDSRWPVYRVIPSFEERFIHGSRETLKEAQQWLEDYARSQSPGVYEDYDPRWFEKWIHQIKERESYFIYPSEAEISDLRGYIQDFIDYTNTIRGGRVTGIVVMGHIYEPMVAIHVTAEPQPDWECPTTEVSGICISPTITETAREHFGIEHANDPRCIWGLRT